MPSSLSNSARRELKARAQRLDPAVRLGHEGASEAFYVAMEDALTRHQLVKVKFTAFKEETKTLAPALAERTASELVAQVGHVAVYFRASAVEAASAT